MRDLFSQYTKVSNKKIGNKKAPIIGVRLLGLLLAVMKPARVEMK
jgi:hypothetical protein